MKPVRRQKKSKIKSTNDRLRLSVFCSNTTTYAQVIDDVSGKTIVNASSLKSKNGSNLESAKKVGTEIAKAAIKAKVNKVVFDRGNQLYHGRVAALADAAREEGLEF